MTKAFDDKARKLLLETLQGEFITYDGKTKVKEMKVVRVDAKFARPYIASFHYSKTFPDSSKFIYAGYLGDRLCGIIVYGMGTGKAQYSSILPDIENGEYCELTRLWSPLSMPKNTESKLISESLKLLPKEIRLVISFADSSISHHGTIYQATNWFYLGKTNGGKSLVTEDGIIKHTRLLGMYKKRHPEYKDLTNEELMNLYGWKYVTSGVKHRYVKFLGDKREIKKNFEYIKNRIENYPKGAEKVDKVDELTLLKDNHNLWEAK